ncbi:MAG: peptidoglycan DD-metalloendopeptidase family protein [Rhodobacteraceae bacterium]|nr:peptidoglycan DD-metalloendopeptidase family protein [Paracoccaceae bacterium]
MAESPAKERPPLLSRLFPEKRIFVKSDNGTRFVCLGPRHHILALLGGTALVLWSVTATSFLVIGIVKGGGALEHAAQEKALYETRLNALAEERDVYRMAALDAQSNFTRALDEISSYQDRLFSGAVEQRELEAGRDALRRLLQEALQDRDTARDRLALLTTQSGDATLSELDRSRAEAESTVDFLARALAQTAEDRNALKAQADAATARMVELQNVLDLRERANDKIFTQLEDAVTLAMEPLGKMFSAVGLPPSQILHQMRDQYSGQGGPLTPISLSTKGMVSDPDALRANAILDDMDELNLYRIAFEKVPFALPVSAHVRSTSGFGYRRDPIRGGTRLHAGLDWAGDYGTTIKATADGVVTHAGWQSGYGRVVIIKHAFGLETRFAHLSKITVQKGQRVSRGERIGAMGNSGRSTGTHLHYEVRLNGTPVDPMTYIKAGRDVF